MKGKRQRAVARDGGGCLLVGWEMLPSRNRSACDPEPRSAILPFRLRRGRGTAAGILRRTVCALLLVAVVPAQAQDQGLWNRLLGLFGPSHEVGEVFRDCEFCPELVVVPSGEYIMGSPPEDRERWEGWGGLDGEVPRHRVEILKSFAVGVYEVTVDQWSRFVEEAGHSADTAEICQTYESAWSHRDDRSWRNPGYVQGASDPVVCVNWHDAREYVEWLSRETGESYRLLSEAEWEYVARAGTTTAFHFGSDIPSNQANYDHDEGPRPVPVGSYAANGFDLHDVHGNVSEWVEDCWHDDYVGAPTDGSAWTSDCDDHMGRTDLRALRGGSWNNGSAFGLRSANRDWRYAGSRSSNVGFRIARTLVPAVEGLTKEVESGVSRVGGAVRSVDCAGWASSDAALLEEFYEGVSPEGVAECLEAGADPNARMKQATPLHLVAALNESALVVESLLEAGADPDARDNDDGLAPLHVAAAVGRNPEVIAALVRGGADPDVRDSRGRTPLDIANDLARPAEIIAALEDGARVAEGAVVATTREPDGAVEDGSSGSSPGVGSVFRDCGSCPELVVVPAGEYMMGSPPGEEYRDDNEGPVHRVVIPRPFAVGVYEVTFDEWDACVSAGGCSHRPDDLGWGRGDRPVIKVNWHDAKAYVGWLSRETGETYRLLTEAEWEYVARAGTTTAYHFGSGISPGQANYNHNESGTVPVGSYAANDFGLHDVHGNVGEWVEDCRHDDYVGAPTDGSAWMSGGDCYDRGLRGGPWSDSAEYLRSANRYWDVAEYREWNRGFRIARTLVPAVEGLTQEVESAALEAQAAPSVDCAGWASSDEALLEQFYESVSPEGVAECLEAGADPNARLRKRATPLHVAAALNENALVVELLLEAGADPNASDNDNGLAPLHLAAALNGNARVVELLLEAGADPDARDNDRGLAPLHGAAEVGRNPEVIAALIRGGADPDVRDRRGRTPLDIANDRGRPAEIIAALEDGARVAEGAVAATTREADGAEVEDGSSDLSHAVGSVFRDCEFCPELVVVPAGSYRMGSPPGEVGSFADEIPRHRVTIARPFAVGVYEVTFDEWDACVSAGGCSHRPDDRGWGRGDRPVINVSWNDAKEYVDWLSRETGEEYRLLAESEWEYVARAGTTTAYHFGTIIPSGQANYGRNEGGTVPVGSYAANGFGLHDVHGNVWEWVEDCWHEDYSGAPTDGSAWTSGEDCDRRVLRGGSWWNKGIFQYAGKLRSAYRGKVRAGNRDAVSSGFRIARALAP